MGPMTLKLHEFRTIQDREWTILELKGGLAEFCRDQYGSRFVQDSLQTATKEEVAIVFDEILESGIVETSKDVFGNYVVQRLLEHGSDEQILAIFNQLIDVVFALSTHIYACRVIQKLLDVIPQEKQVDIVKCLDPYLSECVTNAHANHVIQKILQVVPGRLITFLDDFRGKVVEFSQHSYGCRVIQRCLQHLPASQSQPILEEFMRHAQEMITDQFGNYIIQYLLECGEVPEKDYLLTLIRARFLELTSHKHASNVCEKALMHSPLPIQQDLVDEILSLDNQFPVAVWGMIHNQFGNYVLQRALRLASGVQQKILVDMVKQQLRQAWTQNPSTAICKQLVAIDRVINLEVAPSFHAPPSHKHCRQSCAPSH